VSLFFAAGLRNITAATTIAIAYFPAAAALPTVLGILFQQTTAAIMGRLLMGKAPAAGER
jgi:predicted Na+-dependent transporter